MFQISHNYILFSQIDQQNPSWLFQNSCFIQIVNWSLLIAFISESCLFFPWTRCNEWNMGQRDDPSLGLGRDQRLSLAKIRYCTSRWSKWVQIESWKSYRLVTSQVREGIKKKFIEIFLNLWSPYLFGIIASND